MRNDFAIFILSHGRADSVLTVSTLAKAGYTGKWYIVLDNEDDQEPQYRKNFGDDHIIVFDKVAVGKTFDIMDNFPGRQVPTFARNVLHSLAKDLGLTYFLELEDDYTNFRQRYVDKDDVFRSSYVRDLDAIIDVYLDFLEVSGAVTVAFAQTGDLLGGTLSRHWSLRLSRKAMNCFFCKTDRPFQCYGRFNDDVNSYIENGKRGDLYFTTVDLLMDQPTTQQRSGGITDAYRLYGTYVKSFYSVMLVPSAVKIAEVGHEHKRIHHRIDWEKAVPKIISSKYRVEVNQ